MTEIGLGEAIKALRQELGEARAEGDAQSLRFQPGPIELELAVSVTRDVHGTIGWKIFEVGGAREAGSTQTVKLTLTPQLWDAAEEAYKPDFLVTGELAAPAPGASPPGAPTAPPVVPTLNDGE